MNLPKCIIFGGAGYIGQHIALQLNWSEVVLVDIREPAFELPENCRFVSGDVREPISNDLLEFRPDWIFNLAAIHREPGHEGHEYFDTNIPGARNICAFANATNCKNIYFTSSIATYGSVEKPTPENAPKYPSTPYGISKLAAELIHEAWLQQSVADRRLIVCRPGVVYGPGDPGNILRLIRAVRKRRFFFPGNPDIRKSYAYIDGLIESMQFTMDADEQFITYNYVETPTEPLRDLVSLIQEHFDQKYPVPKVPLMLLVWAAQCLNFITGGNSPIHPTRVRKAALATNIVPQKLIEMGFAFNYPFSKTLKLWADTKADDFEV
ncbi:MAG: NAD-dependent epimerase/dehydratase family protein [Opitutaceae bacterium]